MKVEGSVAREEVRRQAWTEAYDRLRAEDANGRLEPEDLECLAVAAYVVGEDGECDRAWERAHRGWLQRGERARAVQCGFWLGMHLRQRGEDALGGGWLARAGRLLADQELDCVEHGYLHLPLAIQALRRGDLAVAATSFTHASEIGARFADSDLIALAQGGLVDCRVASGDISGGLALLDEVLVAVRSGETTPVPSGIIYCNAIALCQRVFDLRRAQEWTAALDEWSRPQQGLVPYRGQCLVHRSQIMQLHGEWTAALAEARQAEELLSTPRPHPVLSMALYQVAELHRLRGDVDQAEEAYRAANHSGREPQPGLALLWQAQGRVDAAYHAIRRALDEARGFGERSGLLAAHVEIALAAGDVPAARASADELARGAAELDTPMVHAIAYQASGAVLLAEGDARAACSPLRRSSGLWHELEAPYDAARVRVLLGVACRELGDSDGSDLEFEAAGAVFRQLGATPDLARLPSGSPGSSARTPGGLTQREAEVLALAAEGKTNREIAAVLVLSEHTIRRHLQNVFGKLGVSSRAAATRVWLTAGPRRRP